MDPRSPSDSSQAKRCTLKSGCPVSDKTNSLLVGPHGPNLLSDVAYLEETAHFNRERIPERVVHAKGASAMGQFVVSNNCELAKYTKADLFARKGSCTQIVARFSHVTGESGIADTMRDVRGFAVKFYTAEGNWDLVGNNLPVFFIRDPINFTSFIHTQKRNPKTHLRDPDAFWDFVAMLPETLHTILMLFSDRGIPESFRHMHGYGVNTFKLVNPNNQHYFAKFHWVCKQKIRCLDQDQADLVAGKDPDYLLRDLFVNISKTNYPQWDLKYQIMTPEQAQAAKFNVFDVTKIWPFAQFPLHEAGTMRLEANPDNYFAQVEQLAFSPANLVPGIEPSQDKMLAGRIMSYSDAQRYRLGANYADISINQPKCPVFTPTYCDGVTFNSNMNGSLPNYIPSCRYKKMESNNKRFIEQPQVISGNIGRYDLRNDDNFSQPRALVNRVLSEDSRKRLITNLVNHLKMVHNQDIVARVLDHFRKVDKTFGDLVHAGLSFREVSLKQAKEKSHKQQPPQ